MQWTNDAIKSLLQQRLLPDRYVHSRNVASSARTLAEIHGADPDKCYTAGLLHDITKNAPESEHLELFATAGISLTPEEAQNKKLWHAMSGAAYLQYKMGIEDQAMLLAVRYHTTGRAGMTLPERIVYIADFVSAERDYPDVDVMRGLSAVSLEQAMLYALRYTIPNLIKKGQTIHKDSLELYNELIMKG